MASPHTLIPWGEASGPRKTGRHRQSDHSDNVRDIIEHKLFKHAMSSCCTHDLNIIWTDTWSMDLLRYTRRPAAYLLRGTHLVISGSPRSPRVNLYAITIVVEAEHARMNYLCSHVHVDINAHV